MGLMSSMWTGVSGLFAHSEKMGVIGNNLANVNTIGYKASTMQFMDMISQDVGTAAGIGQVGLGVRVGEIYPDMSQGGFQTTNSTTDLAIGGQGFFMVNNKTTGATYYTRAGNFTFDKNGYLVDPHGYNLQGWAVDRDLVRSLRASNTEISQIPIMGSLTDVKVDQFSIRAQATQNMTVITNLDSTATPKSVSTSNPFFGLMSNYHYSSNSSSALPANGFAYSSTMRIYDQNGTPHNVTTYFDKVSNSGGKSYWQFLVTCKGSEDGRTIGGVQMSQTSQAGMLMTGTLTFSPSGDLVNMSAYTLQSNATPTNGVFGLDQWTLARVSNGYPLFTANFREVSNANGTRSSNAVSVGLNLGIHNINGWQSSAASNASLIGTSANRFDMIQGFAPATTVTDNLSTTNFASSSATLFSSQDGYPAGMLQGVSVDSQGVLTGRFSNGQVQELYVIGLADFTNPWGLRREGGNLFSQTLESGQPTTNRPNTGRLGTIASNNLEQSNVDMAREIVDMITTQRGFQANSKVITSADSMLAELIQLKR